MYITCNMSIIRFSPLSPIEVAKATKGILKELPNGGTSNPNRRVQSSPPAEQQYRCSCRACYKYSSILLSVLCLCGTITWLTVMIIEYNVKHQQ